MLSSSEFYGGSSGGGAGEKYSEVPGLSPLSVDIEMTNGLSLLNQSMNTLSGGSLSDPWSTCSPLSQKSPDTDLVHQMDALLKTEPLDLPCASPSDVELLQMSFQNDQSDTLQGPTLAELNAPPASDLLDDLCFDDLMLPEAASGMRSSSRWDHGLGLDEPSSALGATAAELQSAALESMSAASGVNPHFAFDGPDLMLMGATGFGSRLSSANAGNPTAAANRQNMSLGSSVPSSGLTASFDIAGHRFVLTSSGFAPGNAAGSGAVPIGGTSHLATLLSSPSAVGTPPGLGRPIKSEPANAQNPALSSSVPSTCGFSFAQSIMTSGTAPVGVQHQQQVQVQAQAHQVAVAQQQLQNQQMQQLTLLASNLAAVPPSTPTTLIVTSPQQPTQVLQSQLCQMGIGMVGTTVETPSGSSRRSSSASLCSDVISKLTLHNNILHQNRSKAPHQMRPRASTMSGAIGHRRPPKASASSGMQHGNGANGGGLPPQNQPVSGMMKSNFLLASTPDIRLSSSCPNNSMDLVWRKVREPRQHLLSGGSLIESPSHGGSGSSLSTGGVLSPASGAGHDLSHDDDAAYFNSDTEDDDEDSDGDSGGSGDEDGGATSPGAARGGGAHHSGRDRYFWQYNVQAKGPKGQRLVMKKPDPADPHVLDQVVDPVFNPVVAAQGIRHSGKARRGDGNDLTPSPKKLFNIGVELDGLNQAINEMTPVAELPYTDRPKSRKEKNKLASRACRLKKKAQHEANKLTLYGLQEEHRKLMECIEVAKQLIMARLASVFGDATLTMGRELVPIEGPISPKLEAYCDPVLKTRIAGRATDFVNDVLEKVKAGIPNGGLGTLLK